MNPAEILEELDKIFDLLLVLLGIITAAFFQLACTVEPLEIGYYNLTELEFVNESVKAIRRDFAFLFLPLILVIGFWIYNRMFLRKRMYLRRVISEFCYLFAVLMLLIYTSAFIGISFFPYNTTGLNATLQILAFPSFLASFCIVYFYEIPFIYRDNIRTRRAFFSTRLRILVQTIVIWLIAYFLLRYILYLCLTIT